MTALDVLALAITTDTGLRLTHILTGHATRRRAGHLRAQRQAATVPPRCPECGWNHGPEVIHAHPKDPS